MDQNDKKSIKMKNRSQWSKIGTKKDAKGTKWDKLGQGVQKL